MAEPTIHDILSKNFSAVGKDEWLRAAQGEMPENMSIENLLWHVDGITFSPYYVKDDLGGTEYLQSFHHCSHQLLSTSWLNMPDIRVIDEKEANEKALSYLQSGADGIVFNIANLRDPDINKLINNIHWDHCPLSFKVSDTEVATKIFALAEEKHNILKLTGSLWWNELPETVRLPTTVKQLLIKYENYHLFGIQVSAPSPVQEISYALSKGVKLVDEMTDAGSSRDAVFRSISLSFVCDENFLVNIAKLKAARLLWFQLSQAFDVSNYLPSDLHISCRTGKQVNEKFHPHGSMIRDTCQAISAIAGGADEITVTGAEDAANNMTGRVALNVSNILKEESNFDKVADPLAGSYAIEKMVDEFSQAAWAEFQKLHS